MQQQPLLNPSYGTTNSNSNNNNKNSLPPYQAPELIPISSCTDFSNAACPSAVESHSPHHVVDADCCLQDGYTTNSRIFFSAEERDLLREKPAPVDVYLEGARNFGSSAKPEGNVPYYNLEEGSSAEAEFDGYKGVKSCDLLLHSDKSGGEIMKFLSTFNTTPRVMCRVRGYHHEQRTRHVTRKDSDGNEYREREHYTVTIDDFDYRIDISQWIFPHGYIAAEQKEKFVTVEEAIDNFLKDGNVLKTLTMDKVVDFDFQFLKQQIHGYIRSLGWYRGLDISFPRCNHRVKIWKRNCLSTTWESCFGRCMCYMSVVGCLLMHCIKCGHNQNSIKAYYQIEAHPIQIFEAIRPQLWAPGFGQQVMAGVGEMLRDGFW